MLGLSDAQVLINAIREDRVLMTRDVRDFLPLHELILAAGGTHPGIVIVRSIPKKRQRLKPEEVAQAIDKLEKSGTPLQNHVHVLNQWV